MSDIDQNKTGIKEMSKKSEKLEIRLSYEEKQELASVAETEGRTVSELVRGLIRRYVQTSAARLPQKKFWLKWVAFCFLGLLIGHLGTWLYTKSHHHDASIYSLNGNIGGASFTTPVLAKAGYEAQFSLKDKGSEIKISLNVEDHDEGLSILTVDICRQTQEGCENIASPVLHFNPVSSAAISIDDAEGKDIHISLHRPPQ